MRRIIRTLCHVAAPDLTGQCRIDVDTGLDEQCNRHLEEEFPGHRIGIFRHNACRKCGTADHSFTIFIRNRSINFCFEILNVVQKHGGSAAEFKVQIMEFIILRLQEDFHTGIAADRLLITGTADRYILVFHVIQTVNILIIDKKKMKLADAGLPKQVVDSTPKYLRWSKMPIVKAKIGPKVMTLISDPQVFEQLPVKQEAKVVVSGIYITKVKSVRGGQVIQPKKKKFIDRFKKSKKVEEPVKGKKK